MRPSMRILFVSNEYPPDTGFGGIGTYTAYAARCFSSEGHEVDVICRSADGRAHGREDSAVRIHRIPPGTFPLPGGRMWYPLRRVCRYVMPRTLEKLAWAREAFREYLRLRQSGLEFDVIEFPECNAEGFFFTRAGVTGTVVRLHTPWETVRTLDRIPEHPVDRFLLGRLERSAARRAFGVSSPTRALAADLRSRWSLGHVEVYPNPLPVGDFEPTRGGGWIYVGRIEHRKGVHLLLESYALLRSRRSLPPLLLLGRAYGCLADGMEYGDYIRNRINRAGLTETVTWNPGVSGSEVSGYLRSASLAIFPSLWENFSYACLEAMACGLAVVAARCGGYPEILEENRSGMLFEVGDSEDLARVLEVLLDDASLVSRLGSEARIRVHDLCDPTVVYGHAGRWYRNVAGR